MCGILGWVGHSCEREAFERALDSMANRGPDDRGVYLGAEVMLGHRRLAILDLSELGHQPMSCAAGRFTIVYNGEIYNYRNLRRELESEGIRFTSQSDTEVLVWLYAQRGPSFVNSLRGMFAIAIWDAAEKTLFVSRDRLGIKPLYLWKSGGKLAFASEVRALGLLPGGPKAVNPQAVAAFLAWGSVPEPRTIYDKIEALAPGHWGVWKAGELRTTRYWDLPAPTSEVRQRSEAIEHLRPLLEEAVRLRCISDAPLGAFLSGGIDSSGVVSLMRRGGQSDLRTFSLSFPGTAWDEGPFAQQVAERFGTCHQDIKVSESMVADELDHFFSAVDQPTCDGLNTYLISKFARLGGLTVSLSGLGGDELFAGYPTHRRMEKFLSLASRTPETLLQIAGSLATAFPGRWNKLAALRTRGPVARKLYYASRGLFMPGQLGRLLAPELLQAIPRSWSPLEPYLESDGHRGVAPAPDQRASSGLFEAISQELSFYMRNQLLRDSDVFGMHHSLEIRVPLLDHVLVENLFRIAPSVVGAPPPKSLLVESLPDRLPAPCVNRPKMGFTFPFEKWMRGPWRRRFEQEMAESGEMGCLIRREAVMEVWSGFMAGKVHWSRPWALWTLARSVNPN